MSERISTLSRFPLVADRYCSAISSELISELYVSLTILQPFMPSLSSSRMATLCSRGSRFRIGSVSKPSAPYSASASAAFAREAGSSNGSPVQLAFCRLDADQLPVIVAFRDEAGEQRVGRVVDDRRRMLEQR